MKVDLLDREMVNSDLGVVNAARCSFDKESSLTHMPTEHLEEKWIKNSTFPRCTGDNCTQREHLTLKSTDVKLIHYLAQHHHWTPFAHAQETFEFYMSTKEEHNFLIHANLSGFEWCFNKDLRWCVRGSLYAWLTNVRYLPKDIMRNIVIHLLHKYPITTKAVYKDNTSLKRRIPTRVYEMVSPKEPELQSYTLRIHCPIFVKRQLETHRRNFVMTDIEDFAQNEVSRRYVDSKPELYTPKTWRIQSPNKKQGSSEETLQAMDEYLVNSNYDHHTYNALLYYQQFNNLKIAHEQSRMILPLSTYTTFWWTGSLKSWQRLFNLRLDSHAQSETREIAQLCCNVILQR